MNFFDLLMGVNTVFTSCHFVNFVLTPTNDMKIMLIYNDFDKKKKIGIRKYNSSLFLLVFFLDLLYLSLILFVRSFNFFTYMYKNRMKHLTIPKCLCIYMYHSIVYFYHFFFISLLSATSICIQLKT